VSSGSRSRAELANALTAALLRSDDAIALEVQGREDAAVLVPLYLAGSDLRVVLTRRHDDLRVHAGQVSFPGGRREHAEDLRDTALREACEEIGLSPSAVELVGALTPTPTFVTDFAVYPFVGLIEEGQTWQRNDAEVAAIIEPSVRELRDGWAQRPVETPRGTFTSDTYLVGDELIWGATARIVRDLLQALE
jgi:8-oxo-dGTP pyrophosphatase MutT (NUDIX family)